MALEVSALYVFGTAAVSGVILAIFRRRSLLPLCAVAAWLAPVAAFYNRGSLWAVSLAGVLAVLAATAIQALVPDRDASESRPFALMVLAAMLLQATAVALACGMAQRASVFACGAGFLITWFWRGARTGPVRSLLAMGVAFLFAAASFAPYLL